MVAHIAIEIDATDDQKQKLTGIFVGAANDLMPIHAEFIESRQAGELVGLLTAPAVDRAAMNRPGGEDGALPTRRAAASPGARRGRRGAYPGAARRSRRTAQVPDGGFGRRFHRG